MLAKPTDVIALLNFFHEAEKLKTILRHSWTSNLDRQESTADHSWRMAIMAVVLHPYLDIPVDLNKSLQMVLVHDLAEAVVGDVPTFLKKAEGVEEEIHHTEHLAMKRICSKLPHIVGEHMLKLWEEYNHGVTSEAKFTKALDKLEVVLQHRESDRSTWVPEEYPFIEHYADSFCQYDSFLETLNDAIAAIGTPFSLSEHTTRSFIAS